MARRLLLVTYTPHRADDAEAYAEWIRTRDYPAFRQNPGIDEYSCFRIVQSVQGKEWFTHFDLIFVKDGVEFGRDLRGDPVIAEHARGYHELWFDAPGPHNLNVSAAEEIWG